MNIAIYTVVILTIFYLLLKKFTTISSKKISKSVRILLVISLFILAILFLIGFYLFIDFESLDILPIMFTFLAAITFPHVIVIEKMYSSMK